MSEPVRNLPIPFDYRSIQSDFCSVIVLCTFTTTSGTYVSPSTQLPRDSLEKSERRLNSREEFVGQVPTLSFLFRLSLTKAPARVTLAPVARTVLLATVSLAIS